MKRLSSGIAFLLFTGLGQSILGLIQVVWPILPLVAIPLMFLATTVLAQMFVINFSGKAYDRRIAALEERMRPNLLIGYRPEENEPFVQFDEHWTQYRVGVKSPVPIPNVELVVNHLKVGRLPVLFNIHLRPMHERDHVSGTKRVAVKTDKEEYWDLISVQSAPPHPRGVVYLNCLPSFAGGSLEITPGDYEFELMATGGERPPQTKIVSFKVDNNYTVARLYIRDGRL
jgi:hypothetical protein